MPVPAVAPSCCAPLWLWSCCCAKGAAAARPCATGHIARPPPCVAGAWEVRDAPEMSWTEGDRWKVTVAIPAGARAGWGDVCTLFAPEACTLCNQGVQAHTPVPFPVGLLACLMFCALVLPCPASPAGTVSEYKYVLLDTAGHVLEWQQVRPPPCQARRRASGLQHAPACSACHAALTRRLHCIPATGQQQRAGGAAAGAGAGGV